MAIPALGLAKVDARGELPHHQDIKAIAHNIGTERTGRSQRPKDLGRAEVAEQIKMLAQRQQRRTLRLLIGRQAFPLGAAHRTKQDRIRACANVQGLLGQGLAMVVNGNAAHVSTAIFQGKSKALLRHIQNLDGLGHDLGADTVSGQNSYLFHKRLHWQMKSKIEK